MLSDTKMDRQKFFTLLYVGMIVALILFMIFMVFWLKSESSVCVRDPIVYFEEKNEGTVCACYKSGVMFAVNNVRQEINTENYLNK